MKLFKNKSISKLSNRSDNSLKAATYINAASKYSVVIMNLFFTAVLARLLTPDDYGVVAILTVFTNFFVLFTDMGIGTAVIQNKGLSKEDENNIFSFSMAFGLFLAVLFSLFSFVIVYLYKNPAYYRLCPILSLSLMFSTFNMVPNALLMKRKLFMLAGLRKVVANIVSYVIAIVMACLGSSYYAIAFQSVSSALVIFLWNLKSTGVRCGTKHIMSSVKKILNFSVFQFLFSIVNYFTRNLDNLLTGYFFGQEMLGYYDKAYKLMRYPVENLTNVIAPSIQPILSDYQDDSEYIFQKYNKIVKLLALIATFISAFCFFASREVVLLFFGRQWEGSVVCFHILSFSLVFQIVNGISGSVYQSLNKTKQLFVTGIINAVILITSIIIGVIMGNIEGLALSYTIGFVAMFFVNHYLLSRLCFNKSILALLKNFWQEAVIYAVLFVVMFFVPTLDSLILSAILKFGVCIAAYVIMLILTKEYKVYISMLPQKLVKRFEKKKRNDNEAS